MRSLEERVWSNRADVNRATLLGELKRHMPTGRDMLVGWAYLMLMNKSDLAEFNGILDYTRFDACVTYRRLHIF